MGVGIGSQVFAWRSSGRCERKSLTPVFILTLAPNGVTAPEGLGVCLEHVHDVSSVAKASAGAGHPVNRDRP